MLSTREFAASVTGLPAQRDLSESSERHGFEYRTILSSPHNWLHLTGSLRTKQNCFRLEKNQCLENLHLINKFSFKPFT